MPQFRFETISVQEAAGFGAADSLQFDGAGGSQTTVLYGADRVTIAFAGRSLDFGLGIVGQLGTRFADGAMLYVGATVADSTAGTAFGDGLYGGMGGDSLDGGDGGDLLQGNQGEDSLAGGLGSDVLYGGQDNDQIRVSVAGSTASETNFVNGNKGDDIISGGPGSDILLGGQGQDFVSGGDGGDFILGNLGDDVLAGEDGEDTLSGEGGADIMTGGDGVDLFRFAAGSSDAAGAVVDTIMDWSLMDRIHTDAAQPGFAAITAPSMPGYRYGGYTYPPVPGDESFGAMLGQANQTFAGNLGLGIIAAKTGLSVTLFVDTDGDHTADLAIILSGTSLFSVSAANFV